MKKTTTKLTETQKAFAAENHNLVYEFLRSKGLSDDFYDTVIFRYLHAVQIYDERPKLQKYNFKTIAFNNMRSALGHHYEKQQRMKRNATVLSFDAIGKNNLPLSETTAGGTLVYEYAEMKDAWNQVDSVLTQNQRNTVSLRAQGYSGNEIAQVYRLAPSSVYGRLQLIRKKAKQIAAYGTPSSSWIHVTGNRASSEAFITEGGLKGDIASYLSGDRLFICTAGATSIRYLSDTLTALKIQKVNGCFDMDKLTELNALLKKRRENPWDEKAKRPSPLEKMEAVVKSSGLPYTRCQWAPELNGIDNYYFSQLVNHQIAS